MIPYCTRPKACTASDTVSLAFDGGGSGSVADRNDPGAVPELGRSSSSSSPGSARSRSLGECWCGGRPRVRGEPRSLRRPNPNRVRPSADITVCVHSRTTRTSSPVSRKPSDRSRSVPVVSHHLDGFLRTRLAGVLQPAAGWGSLRFFSDHAARSRATSSLVNQEERHLATRALRRTGVLARRARGFPRSAHTPRRIPLTGSRTASLRPAALPAVVRAPGEPDAALRRSRYRKRRPRDEGEDARGEPRAPPPDRALARTSTRGSPIA